MTIAITPTPAISVRVGDRIRYDQDTWELVEREVQDPEGPSWRGGIRMVLRSRRPDGGSATLTIHRYLPPIDDHLDVITHDDESTDLGRALTMLRAETALRQRYAAAAAALAGEARHGRIVARGAYRQVHDVERLDELLERPEAVILDADDVLLIATTLQAGGPCGTVADTWDAWVQISPGEAYPDGAATSREVLSRGPARLLHAPVPAPARAAFDMADTTENGESK